VEPKIELKTLSNPPPNKSSTLIFTPWNPPAPNGEPPGPLCP